jgi:hypothetical protein
MRLYGLTTKASPAWPAKQYRFIFLETLLRQKPSKSPSRRPRPASAPAPRVMSAGGFPARWVCEWGVLGGGPAPRLPSRSAPVPVDFRNGGDHEAEGASYPSGFKGQLVFEGGPALAECIGSYVFWEPVRLRSGVAPGPPQPALAKHVAIGFLMAT